MLGNGNRVVDRAGRGAGAAVVPVDDPHFLFASDGAAAVEQALKIAFQYWTNQGVAGRTSYLAFGGAYHGDTIGALSRRRRRVRHRRLRPAALPGAARAAASTTPGASTPPCAMVAAHADELAAVVVEPLVQGAAGMQLADPDGARARSAPRAASTTCC